MKTLPIMSIAIVVIALITLFLVNGNVSAFLKQQAVETCLTAAHTEAETITNFDQATTTTTDVLPHEEWYKRCMKESGY